jgi:dUTP pyrophosphatase
MTEVLEEKTNCGLGPIVDPDPRVLYYAPLSDYSKMITRVHDGDCGFDLYVGQPATIPSNSFRDVTAKCRIALPEGTWGLILGRSSTIRKRGLFIPPAVIDSGYRGEVYVGIWNMSESEQRLYGGERLAQLIVVPMCVPVVKMIASVNMPMGDRGHDGFGSSGE